MNTEDPPLPVLDEDAFLEIKRTGQPFETSQVVLESHAFVSWDSCDSRPRHSRFATISDKIPNSSPETSVEPDRLDERDIAKLITAYRDGATAASIAIAHGVSLSSVKRLLHTAGVRRTPSTRGSTKATPTATYP